MVFGRSSGQPVPSTHVGVRNSLHQLADFRLQKLIRNDQRLERLAHGYHRTPQSLPRQPFQADRHRPVDWARGSATCTVPSWLGRPECSHYVLMKSSEPKRRFPRPWRVERAGTDCYEIRDAYGFQLATVHRRDDLQKWSFGHSHLTSDEARRAIARFC